MGVLFGGELAQAPDQQDDDQGGRDPHPERRHGGVTPQRRPVRGRLVLVPPGLHPSRL